VETPLIELRDVGHGYGGRPLFAGLSLALQPGAFHFLTGPSGAGKTTLIRLCAAELHAGQGAVALFGEDARAMDRDAVALARRRIGVVHQDGLFLDHLSVAENILLPMTVAGRRPEGLRHLPELLGWVGLVDQAGQLPPELSGGERQRAALARAVITAPDVILADEPTGNLDWDTSLRLLALLAELNRMGTAILIATHDLGLIRAARAQGIAARTLRLAGGTLQAAGADL
jgi:cell division transport system ATP-binding protein